MITATDLELRAGSRILLSDATLRVQPGDRIGLVGRNGAGKTTTLRVLAGEGEPYGGHGHRARGRVGYLPQDPREGDLDVTAKDRVLSARGLDVLLARDGEGADRRWPSSSTARERDAAVARVRPHRGAVLRARRVRRRERGRPDLRQPRPAGPGARPADAHAVRRPAPPRRAGPDPVRRVRRRSGGASSATTLLLDEPTNHLDADSITWLRDFLQAHDGGLVVISHDVELLAAVVNKVWFLDAVRGEVDVYNMGWQRYLEARATDEQRRRRERANAEKKASALHDAGGQDGRQGDQGRRGAEHGAPRRRS